MNQQINNLEIKVRLGKHIGTSKSHILAYLGKTLSWKNQSVRPTYSKNINRPKNQINIGLKTQILNSRLVAAETEY